MIICTKHYTIRTGGHCPMCETLRTCENRETRLVWVKRHVRSVLESWVRDAWSYITGKTGYRFLATLIAVYIGLYSIMVTRHERGMNRALFERATFMSMVSSGNKGSLIAALKNFGPTQTISIYSEPYFFRPYTWFLKFQPNKNPLWIWALNFFPLCTESKKECGDAENQFRIDLSKADLSGAKLKGVMLVNTVFIDSDLSNADLRDANLTRAYLNDVNLNGTDLRGAIIYKTSFARSTLHGANLTDTIFGFGRAIDDGRINRVYLSRNPPPDGVQFHGADFKDAKMSGTEFYGADFDQVKNLTPKQLSTICVDHETLITVNPRPQTCPAVLEVE